MINLIIAIILALVGITFIIWGIYQIRTGKMVAKRAKKPIDEPKQVGALFTIIGVTAFWLAVIVEMYSIEPEQSDMIGSVAWGLKLGLILSVLIFVICIVFYGLKNQRIFGLKNPTKIAKYTKKYYKLVNLSLPICLIAALILFLLGGYMPWFLVIIIALIMMVTIVVPVGLMIKIAREYRK